MAQGRDMKKVNPEGQSFLWRFRWGLLFASVYSLIALSCYILYVRDRHEYSIPLFIVVCLSFPVYVVFAEVLRPFLITYLDHNEAVFVMVIIFLTAIVYFCLGEVLAYLLRTVGRYLALHKGKTS
jgi:hypothetical protein